MFVDDVVLVGENRKEVNNRLNEWMSTLKGKRLRINRNKTE
jgi:hypothetical protein